MNPRRLIFRRLCLLAAALIFAGSGVANVVTTGQFTIPLMKRFGYRPAFAGGVEATASMGAQIMPPVMGAVAFIMAETLNVPYIEIVKAAIATMQYPGLAQTNVGRGLALAAGAFGADTAAASRAILLVSDGAGVISREVQAQLRDAIARRPVDLYWLFLRTEGAKGIFDLPASGERDTPQTRPERHLHLFLQTLGVPYRAFEADGPDAVREAIAEIDRLEARPIAYWEEVPRLDLPYGPVGCEEPRVSAFRPSRCA